MGSQPPVVIVGGGLAGSLAALALRQRRPALPILLLEAGKCLGGNHTWSFFDGDVPTGCEELVSALEPVHWPRHRVRFADRDRVLSLGYNSVSSPALDALVRRRLPQGSWRLGATAKELEADGVVLATGERIAARAVIDARGPERNMQGLELGWQKFVGIEFAATPEETDCATVMDATVPQIDGYRFLYVLPLARDRVLMEDTYYSTSPSLDVPGVAARVRQLARARAMSGEELRHETGILPVVISGDPEAFWPSTDPVARLGLRGGFFHQTTGYSFGMAVRVAEELSRLDGELDNEALARWTRMRFLGHWRSSGYYRLLNRMLFRAASPGERHRVFSHFYRLPTDVIARFYAGSLTATDRMRILSGKPPVPIAAALAALAGLSREWET
jgi:lycopene beta-cyclase